jgi:copper chaperone CopZ
MEKFLKFKIANVLCNTCVYRVKKGLLSLPKVHEVNIVPNYDLGIAEVIIKAEEEINKEEIEEILREISEETPYHEYKPIWD